MHARLAVPALALCACAVAHPPPPRDAQKPARPSIAFAMPDVPPAPPPPIALATDEDHALRLAALEARTRVNGPLASTELHLRFVSDVARVTEGRFRITLPPRSFANRLAMKIEDKWREADVVETAVARATFEETMHVRRDPLLVEQRDDNELTARVFPIPAFGEKEIIVGWVSEIGASSPITIPLRGLDTLGDLDIRVTSGATELYARSAMHFVPPEDVRVAAPEGAAALRSGENVALRVRVPGSAAPEPIGRGILVLVDTSASTATELDATLALVRDVASRLASDEPSARFVVATFDQDVRVVHEGGAELDPAIARIQANGALGASDLGAALAWAAKRTDVDRVLLVGDGLATAGTSSRSKLRDAAASIAARIDAIAVGDVRDEPLLRDLAHGGAVSSASLGADAIAARLHRRAVAKTAVWVAGAKWSWPTTIENALEGDERFVYAELPEGVPLRANVGGRAIAPAIASSNLSERAVAKAKIDA
ncbi:MAG TPA: VIT domain-containing protein, partial [Labilithrix sp.]